MEMKKFACALLAALGLIISIGAHAGSPASGHSNLLGNITIPPVDSDSTQFGKCPPFCH